MIFAPIALLIALASMLGAFIFFIDPSMQKMLSLSSWPLIARFLHDGAPILTLTILSIIPAILGADCLTRRN